MTNMFAFGLRVGLQPPTASAQPLALAPKSMTRSRR